MVTKEKNNMSSDFYSKNELSELGLKRFGENVLISKKCSIYGAENISVGNNVRIDDFCILSGNINIGNYVHISAYSALYGSMGIKIADYCGISSRCTLLSASDDFSGEFMINPTVPKEFTNVTGGLIKLEKFVQIGVNSVVMPKITLKEGSVVAAMSFVNENLDGWTIYAGIPVKKIKARNKNIIELEKRIKK